MTNQEKEIKRLLGGYIEIKPAYNLNFAILKNKETLYIGTYEEINGFIAGMQFLEAKHYYDNFGK